MDIKNLTKLLQTGRYYQRRKGQVIRSYEDKTMVNLIETGYIKRYLISGNGTLSIQSIYGPGYFFPLTSAFLALFDQKIYEGEETYYYEAMTDVGIYSLDREIFAKAATDNPLIYKEVLFEAGRRLQSNIQHVENASFKNSSLKIAHELVFLAKQFGEETAKGTKIAVPLTHQDLGDILNLSRETVSREMNKFKKQGIIDSDAQRHIVILRSDSLKNLLV
jgi:CRP-like cAMP-binding protein